MLDSTLSGVDALTPGPSLRVRSGHLIRGSEESMRRTLWALVSFALAVTPTSLPAQGLRDKISELFIFTAGKDPLFLGGTAGSDSATPLHADHFVPSANADNGSLISFISSAISQNVGNLPVSATSGGSTFRFEAGVPGPPSGPARPPLRD